MNTCIVDQQFGDTGKGKISDLLSPDYKHTVRYNGGSNAGHTVVVNGEITKYHLIPCGGKNRVLAHGMVIDPRQLAKEIKRIPHYLGVKVFVSEKAHVVMPWHIVADARKGGKIGTTVRGIGPTYADKMHRWNAIRMGDLVSKLKSEKLERFFATEQALYGKTSLYDEYLAAAEYIQQFICDTGSYLREAVSKKEDLLFESANGMMLDIDFGSYPYVTSSAVGPAAIPQACALPNLHLDRIIGVVKCYSTRVGEGPFPSELGCIEGACCCGNFTEDILPYACGGHQYSQGRCDWCVNRYIREIGKEFGTTTGRPRRIGWFDADVVKYTVAHTAATELAMMHVDTLYGFKKVGIYTNGVVEYMDGWNSYKDDTFNKYIEKIEELVGVPVKIISHGPDREDTVFRT